jgi:Yip1-like protein
MLGYHGLPSWRKTGRPMADGLPDSIAPFLNIWTQPRATIRKIVDSDPTRHVLALVVTNAVLGALLIQWQLALRNPAGLSTFWPITVVIITVLYAVFGVIGLYVGGAIWRWSGSLIGGTATSREVRAAIAWSQVPMITISMVILAALLIFGAEAPTILSPTVSPHHLVPRFTGLSLLPVVLGIWGLIVELKCLGEVHRFSAWRALGATLIPGAIAIVAMIVIYLIFHGVGRGVY